MMVGMMFMMRGNNGQQQGNDTNQRRDQDAVNAPQDSTRTSSQPRETTLP